jgi:transcriptional regulator with GAF, ATPase, and Fis domain
MHHLFRLDEICVSSLEEAHWRSVMEKVDRNSLIEDVCAEDRFEEIIGNSAPLKFVLAEVQRVAQTDSTVLVLGETGAGKEVIAEAVHKTSARRDRPFIKLNCAAIPFDLLESELFGYEKGAFTGAFAQKLGRFEMADTGTLFLDEIGDIPLALQPKLLRVLQEKEFERLGSGKTHRINIRLVAATHRNLEEMVARQQFRSDLYYRLNVFPIMLPPLRERREDIALLVSHFVEVFARRMGKWISSIPKETLDAFTSYSWPGNVRELQNLIERAVILSDNGVLANPLPTLDPNPVGANPTTVDFVALPSAQEGTFRDSQRTSILRALHASGWIVAGPRGAAARLGLKRTTLISKMKKLGISRPVRQLEVAGLNQNREPDRPWQPAAD